MFTTHREAYFVEIFFIAQIGSENLTSTFDAFASSTIDESRTTIFAASSSESHAKMRIFAFAISAFASSTRVPKTMKNEEDF